MQKMKKTIPVVVIVCTLIIVLPVALLAVGPLYNDALLWNLENDLENALSKGDIEMIETESVCGKLNGNGNGMNYFAAVLVKADPEALDACIADLASQYETVEYVAQMDGEIDVRHLEHAALAYSHSDYTDGGYYTVYIYESELNSFPLDIRGH